MKVDFHCFGCPRGHYAILTGSLYRSGYGTANATLVTYPCNLMTSRWEAATYEEIKQTKIGSLQGEARTTDLEQAKAAVLVSLRSPESQRSYRHSIDEFILWRPLRQLCFAAFKSGVVRCRLDHARAEKGTFFSDGVALVLKGTQFIDRLELSRVSTRRCRS